MSLLLLNFRLAEVVRKLFLHGILIQMNELTPQDQFIDLIFEFLRQT